MARFMQHLTDESDPKTPSWSLIGRFTKYYRPYGKLFSLDMTCSILHVVFALLIPYFARAMFRQAETSGEEAAVETPPEEPKPEEPTPETPADEPVAEAPDLSAAGETPTDETEAAEKTDEPSPTKDPEDDEVKS